MIKGPLEQCIKFSLHQHEEEREVSLVPHPVAIEVGSDAHLVAVSAR